MRQNLDERYLGQWLPRTLEERVLLIGWLLELIREEGDQWVQRNGEDWVRRNQVRFLEEADHLSRQGELQNLARERTKEHAAAQREAEEEEGEYWKKSPPHSTNVPLNQTSLSLPKNSTIYQTRAVSCREVQNQMGRNLVCTFCAPDKG